MILVMRFCTNPSFEELNVQRVSPTLKVFILQFFILVKDRSHLTTKVVGFLTPVINNEILPIVFMNEGMPSPLKPV